MRLPQRPPNFESLINELESNKTLSALIRLQIGPTIRDNYYPWDKVRRLKPIDGLDSKSWWAGIKLARRSLYKPLPLLDYHGKPHQFAQTSGVIANINKLHQELYHTPFTLLDSYYVNSQIEEAINSSQLEGASTTRLVARDMLLQGRKPKDVSEYMIANNFKAMQFIQEIKNEDLTVDVVMELHSILTKNTMEDSNMAGQFRKESDDVHVWDPNSEEIVHTPPKAHELPKRLEVLCNFANGYSGEESIDPITRAILVHFALAYDHPFVDGNGRTARALFYWTLLHAGYPLVQYISISEILKKGPLKYGRSFIYTENDENDTTYFIAHQLDTIMQAIKSLTTHLEHKIKETVEIDQLLTNAQFNFTMNFRQKALLHHALKHQKIQYLISIHQKCNDITYDTARNDLLSLEKFGLFLKHKKGKAFYFIAVPNLREILKDK